MTAQLTQMPASAPVQDEPLTRPASRWFDRHPALGISLIDHLWNRLDGAYPRKWRELFPSKQAVDNWSESWVEAFEEEGVQPSDVQIGLKECRRRFAWPPTCAEFIQACKPFLDPTVAYYEAIAGLEARGKGEAGVWTHPAVYWATTGLSRDLMSQTHGQMKERWEAALKRELARGAWEPIPEARVQLPPPEASPMAKEHAEDFLRKAGAAGIGSAGTPGADPKRWARRILERAEKGDPWVTISTLHSAQEALGLRERRPGDHW